MGLMLGIYNAPPSAGGQLLLDCTPFVRACSCSTDEHGFEGLSATIERALSDAFRLYDTPLLYVGLFANGYIIWDGRLEDPSIASGAQGTGLSIQALGAWRALSDLPFTALYSTTQIGGFVAVTSAQAALRLFERWTFSTNANALYIAPNKGEAFPNGTIGELTFETPVGGNQAINGIQFDVDFTAPALPPPGWTFRVLTYNRDFTGVTTQYTLNGTGAQVLRSVHLTFTAQDRISFLFSNETGGPVLKASDTGVDYARITNIRIVSAIAERVNTTLTANRAAGVNVTATVGSTAGMYVGQLLVINSAGNPSESAIVLSIGNSTQFNATFINNYVIGNAVQGHRVTTDHIVRDIINMVSATNSGQINSSTALVQATGLDITDAIYEDASMIDVVTSLAALGDGTARTWEAGVYEDRLLFFRPRGSVARAWYVDVTDLSVARSTEQLFNQVYPIYQDANGIAQRPSATSDTVSIARYGLSRTKALAVQTTSSAVAALYAATALANSNDPSPHASISFAAIYDASGARYPLWMVRAGDTITIRNLPPGISPTIDRIRTFRITHTSYDAVADTLEVEPETAPPTLEVMLARGT